MGHLLFWKQKHDKAYLTYSFNGFRQIRDIRTNTFSSLEDVLNQIKCSCSLNNDNRKSSERVCTSLVCIKESQPQVRVSFLWSSGREESGKTWAFVSGIVDLSLVSSGSVQISYFPAWCKMVIRTLTCRKIKLICSIWKIHESRTNSSWVMRASWYIMLVIYGT